jgi:hypothetical protein
MMLLPHPAVNIFVSFSRAEIARSLKRMPATETFSTFARLYFQRSSHQRRHSDSDNQNLRSCFAATRKEPMPTKLLLALALFSVATIAAAQPTGTPIDRHALVTRHNIEVHTIDPNGAMAVGNGHFAFNFDVTGLQSFPTTTLRRCP